MKLLLILAIILCAGCSSSQIKSYDKVGFPITNTENIKFSTELKLGVIKSGHSSWILTKDFTAGKNPKYFCMEQQRHSWFDHTWMFDETDQNTIHKNINDILISHGSYDPKSKHKVVIFLEKINQGPGDFTVYTFDVDILIFKEGKEEFYKKHHLKGNEMSEEFFASGSWSGAKRRATNRLIDLIVDDINSYLNKSNKSNQRGSK